MRTSRCLAFASAFLAVMTAFAPATGEPFLYFATDDPFVEPGKPATRNDIYIFGGVSTQDTFGGALRFWDTDYTSNYMIGAVYGRDFYELPAGFVLGGVAGLGLRFGDDDDASGELWAGMRLRHHGLVIGNVAISPGFTAGFSLVTDPTQIEQERAATRDGDATFLGFVGPEIAIRFRQAPNLELVYQIHHRSGANGTIGDMGEGSNVNTLGLRYRF
ncbi:hypothetical protein NYR54_14255 [Chelativorans sp. SCAU2101]|jgi:hypothetical protein|uniref:Outer membrane protein beta-barrel domain-containing protein n=1 Tax=Chelativorans petroleitrophicus TaxID=2975484 RepID=A0A9X3B0I1_9HYPH|nr:hypothetical protein [Chelativorans petroleitrophicus]MCT8991444.1 hypothetical protein [Chelativorans petroleitrophicus]